MRKIRKDHPSPKPLKRPKNLKPGEFVEITWDDHWSGAGWREHDEVMASDAVLCKSAGYFLGFSKQGDIILSGSKGESDVNGVMYRLWPTVRSVRKLR